MTEGDHSSPGSAHDTRSHDDKIRVSLTHKPLDCSEILSFVKDPSCGAVVYFGGTTRDNMDGKQVVRLSYEAYEPLAIKTLKTIAQQALKKWPLRDGVENQTHVGKIAIVHRLGEVPVMEESVMIAVSAAHRREGWDAAEWILERIKESAEIWKNEKYTDGSTTWRSNEADQREKDERS